MPASPACPSRLARSPALSSNLDRRFQRQNRPSLRGGRVRRAPCLARRRLDVQAPPEERACASIPCFPSRARGRARHPLATSPRTSAPCLQAPRMWNLVRCLQPPVAVAAVTPGMRAHEAEEGARRDSATRPRPWSADRVLRGSRLNRGRAAHIAFVSCLALSANQPERPARLQRAC